MDCTNTKNFINEFNRMCSIRDCKECKLNDFNNDSASYACKIVAFFKTDLAINEVQSWSDANPIRTFKDAFLEKFPNATICSRCATGDVVPKICLKNLYGIDKCPTNEFGNILSCESCWNLPYKEGGFA